ncbi:alpha-1,2-fucosyltransferase [Vibrio sp. 10N.261.49.A5]|uniref:Alpha-1,2-fucosyltransferase n=1 Tax=Vibrio tasmaniensis 1F-267 TaxID=1191324 RepID=A0ABX3B2A6_9VIBR|nr:alpha-1,2-fucosyltransferase [Vibrio tasmaniensis]OEF43737.1 hypothetical protein A163_01355 [Vibrio tasmaniensis 1F-267]
MKIVNLNGGLGNVLFQLSMALQLKETYLVDVKLDYSGLSIHQAEKVRFFLKYCDFDFGECTYLERLRCGGVLSRDRVRRKEANLLSTIFRGHFYQENNSTWGELPESEFKYYMGYFQSYSLANKYKRIFSDALERIAKDFDFCTDEYSETFVHVRRGDYMSENAIKHHGVTSMDYYIEAMKHSNSNNFRIFTNDIEWVKKNIYSFGSSSIKISEFETNFQYLDILELYLMSKHEKGIIANSTFSFWAALLSRKKEVICPQEWFKKKELQQRASYIKSKEWINL